MGCNTSLLSPCGRNTMYAHQGSNKNFLLPAHLALFGSSFASRD
nr:MAG TPA_asm: hypothetical protein [Caudoviricetes sp.]